MKEINQLCQQRDERWKALEQNLEQTLEKLRK